MKNSRSLIAGLLFLIILTINLVYSCSLSEEGQSKTALNYQTIKADWQDCKRETLHGLGEGIAALTLGYVLSRPTISNTFPPSPLTDLLMDNIFSPLTPACFPVVFLGMRATTHIVKGLYAGCHLMWVASEILNNSYAEE